MVLASPSDSNLSVSSPLLSAPLSDVGCALLGLRPAYAVLPPCAVILFSAWRVLSPPPPSFSLLVPSLLLHPLSPLPPLPCFDSLPFRPWIYPLLIYPHLCHPSGSCVCLHRPLRLLPCPRPPISPVRKNMLATGQAGVRHAGRLRVGPLCPVSALNDPSMWWGTESAVPCYYAGPKSSTPCNVDQRSGICMAWRTGLQWSRSSARCSYIPA